MNDDYPDIPWLKIIGSGFWHGMKWAGVSMLVGIPAMFFRIDQLTVETCIRFLFGVSVLVMGLAGLVAFLAVSHFAYYRYRWMRVLVMTVFVLFFGLQILPLLLAPYLMIWGLIVSPPSWSLLVAVIFALYGLFLYWWTKKVIYNLFVKYNVIGKLAGWIMRTANETEEYRKQLKKSLADI